VTDESGSLVLRGEEAADPGGNGDRSMTRWWLLVLALLGGCAALRSLFPEPYPYQVTPGSVKIDGPVARAAGVAVGDYLEHVTAKNTELRSWDPDAGGFTSQEIERNKPLWDCVEDPRGYDVWYRLDDGGTRYLTEIYTRPEVCFGRGGLLFGGGALYEVDAKSFTILNRDLEDMKD
jgi:hypothetical protein